MVTFPNRKSDSHFCWKRSSRCRGRIFGQQVHYTARAGYSGRDLVIFQTFFPAGRSFLTSIPIIIK